jgi:hypothetical protein
VDELGTSESPNGAGGSFALVAMHSQVMRSLLSPHGVYSPADVDTALARVFGAGVRPLHIEEAMLEGWRVNRPSVWPDR